MTTKTKLKWRLGRLPEPQEVSLLLKEGVLTKEEAREILFSLETEEEQSVKDLKAEIKFLKELVEKLSVSRSTVVESIRYIEKPYYNYGWYHPYQVYCTTGNTITTAGYASATGSLASQVQSASNTANTVYLANGTGGSAGGTTAIYSYTGGSNGTGNGFSKIK